MTGLQGKYIGIAAERRANELRHLVEKNGGRAIILPIQGERWLNASIAKDNVRHFITYPFDWAVFTTGIGAEALEKAANTLDCLEAYIRKLKETKLAIRGSKTKKWLSQFALEPDIISPDGTMSGLVEAMRSSGMQAHHLFYQSYDQEEEQLIEDIKGFSSSIYHSRPYQYLEPEQDVLNDLRFSITSQSLDAVLFTSKSQVQNLFSNISQSQEKLLLHAFQTKVLAVAVGKVTAEALNNYGVKNVLQPKREKMGAMVITLSSHYQQQYNH